MFSFGGHRYVCKIAPKPLRFECLLLQYRLVLTRIVPRPPLPPWPRVFVYMAPWGISRTIGQGGSGGQEGSGEASGANVYPLLICKPKPVCHINRSVARGKPSLFTPLQNRPFSRVQACIHLHVFLMRTQNILRHTRTTPMPYTPTTPPSNTANKSTTNKLIETYIA